MNSILRPVQRPVPCLSSCPVLLIVLVPALQGPVASEANFLTYFAKGQNYRRSTLEHAPLEIVKCLLDAAQLCGHERDGICNRRKTQTRKVLRRYVLRFATLND